MKYMRAFKLKFRNQWNGEGPFYIIGVGITAGSAFKAAERKLKEHYGAATKYFFLEHLEDLGRAVIGK